MDGLDSCLLAGFRTHFPNYSKLQVRTITHQCEILQVMLQAAIHVKMEYTNIRTIASEAIGTGQAFSTQVNASQAKKIISQYKGGDEGSHKSGSTASHGILCCYGCSKPHPWLTHKNGIYVIRCPNAGNPGVHKNAKKTIECICNIKQKKKHFQKHKNLATTNYSDFDDVSMERIWQQVLQSNSVPSDAASVSSSITGLTGGTSPTTAGAGRGCGGKPVVFMYDVKVLQTATNRPILPVAIQSIMRHITHQIGLVPNDSHSPSI
jgi:hypothetical protein